MYNRETSKIELEETMRKEKMRRMCCVCLSLVLAFGMVGCKGEEAPKSYEYTQSETVIVTETEQLQITIEKGVWDEDNENDRNWAVYRLEQAYNHAVDFLGEEYANEKKIRCCICAGDGLTRISEGMLDIYFYETVEQPYTNYMIQILAGTNAPDWLREGLAAYGADLKEESLIDSYGISLTELDALRAVENKEKAEYANISKLAQILYAAAVYEEAVDLGDMLKAISSMETAEEAARYHAAYCIYAGSFVQYLVENKGLDQVLRVYKGEEFDNVMGQTMHALKNEWIAETLRYE